MTDPRNSLAMARIVTLAVPFLLITAVALEAVQAHPEQNSARVEYTDLDLTHPRGRAEFEKRLDRAIKDVCRQGFFRSARAPTQTRACIQAVRRSIKGQKKAALAYKGVIE